VIAATWVLLMAAYQWLEPNMEIVLIYMAIIIKAI
jgi:hypothetical protein